MFSNKTGYNASTSIHVEKRGGVVGREWRDFKLLMRSVPCAVVALFAVSVVLMNLLANKELHTGLPWLALDCGFLVSWLSFLVMDMITKRFGARASIQISAFAVTCNLFVCAVLIVVKHIPGNWGAFYDFGLVEVNQALNNTFGGTWYVLFGSTVAFLASAVVNALLNAAIGRATTTSGFRHFALRSYVSTMLAQFVDNLIFALIVSYVFFGWSLQQVFFCSLAGCLMELLCEVVFSPVGYKVSKQWERDNVGSEYINRDRGVSK